VHNIFYFSLLNILAGRKIKGVTGHVVFSGRLIPHNFKYIIGYVPQVSIIVILNYFNRIVLLATEVSVSIANVYCI